MKNKSHEGKLSKCPTCDSKVWLIGPTKSIGTNYYIPLEEYLVKREVKKRKKLISEK